MKAFIDKFCKYVYLIASLFQTHICSNCSEAPPRTYLMKHKHPIWLAVSQKVNVHHICKLLVAATWWFFSHFDCSLPHGKWAISSFLIFLGASLAHHHVYWSYFIVGIISFPPSRAFHIFHQVHDQMYVDAEAHNMAQAAYAQKRRLGSIKTWEAIYGGMVGMMGHCYPGTHGYPEMGHHPT